jgi:hypothetical protein
MRRCIVALIALILCAPAARAETTEAILDSLQYGAFQYFWNEANPANGLIKDRDTPGSPCSIAATGFGLSAICIGVDHGWVSRTDAQTRVLTTLQTFWNQPQGSGTSGFIGYRGLYYHFLDMTTAVRTWDSELSTIDTALLFAGILDARQYFNTSDPADSQIRALADTIVHRADWNFMRNFNPGILMGWKPATSFAGFGQWIGYNEAMILYILALGSPSHAVPTSAWTQWTSGYNWNTYNGQTYVVFPPLFGHQYSHCWVDFRFIQDAYMQGKGITYFENSRRATLAQQNYSIANPGHWIGYGDSLWGLTASDEPAGYSAHGAPPAQNDNGTITPTAPISSIAFAPEIVLPTIRNLYNGFKSQLWSPYGFKDAFNLSQGWWDTDVLGIDQGPIILMIENYRNHGVWNRISLNPDIRNGLARAGFVYTGPLAVDPEVRAPSLAFESIGPNPFHDAATIRYRLPQRGNVRLAVYDLGGRRVASLVDGEQGAGVHAASFRGAGLPSGIYHVRLESGGSAARARCVLIR